MPHRDPRHAPRVLGRVLAGAAHGGAREGGRAAQPVGAVDGAEAVEGDAVVGEDVRRPALGLVGVGEVEAPVPHGRGAGVEAVEEALHVLEAGGAVRPVHVVVAGDEHHPRPVAAGDEREERALGEIEELVVLPGLGPLREVAAHHHRVEGAAGAARGERRDERAGGLPELVEARVGVGRVDVGQVQDAHRAAVPFRGAATVAFTGRQGLADCSRCIPRALVRPSRPKSPRCPASSSAPSPRRATSTR